MKPDFLHKTWHRNLLEQNLYRHRHRLRGRILDIGSKNRRYDNFFAGAVTAVDIIPNGRLDIGYANIEQRLPFPGAAFNGVLCLEVFEYLENYRRAISEIYRVTKPGGYVIVSLPFLYHAHQDKLRFTEEYIVSCFGRFPSVQCDKIGNGYTVIWDIMRKKIMSLTSQPLRLALLLLASPYLIIGRLLKLDQLTDQYYSGLFLVIKR